MASATEYAFSAKRWSVRGGHSGVRLPPVIVNWLLGMGKTHWARRSRWLIDARSGGIDEQAMRGCGPIPSNGRYRAARLIRENSWIPPIY